MYLHRSGNDLDNYKEEHMRRDHLLIADGNVRYGKRLYFVDVNRDPDSMLLSSYFIVS